MKNSPEEEWLLLSFINIQGISIFHFMLSSRAVLTQKSMSDSSRDKLSNNSYGKFPTLLIQHHLCCLPEPSKSFSVQQQIWTIYTYSKENSSQQLSTHFKDIRGNVTQQKRQKNEISFGVAIVFLIAEQCENVKHKELNLLQRLYNCNVGEFCAFSNVIDVPVLKQSCY